MSDNKNTLNYFPTNIVKASLIGNSRISMLTIGDENAPHDGFIEIQQKNNAGDIAQLLQGKGFTIAAPGGDMLRLRPPPEMTLGKDLVTGLKAAQEFATRTVLAVAASHDAAARQYDAEGVAKEKHFNQRIMQAPQGSEQRMALNEAKEAYFSQRRITGIHEAIKQGNVRLSQTDKHDRNEMELDLRSNSFEMQSLRHEVCQLAAQMNYLSNAWQAPEAVRGR